MSDNRKYYYLKLKEHYFDDDSIVLLESMQEGVLSVSYTHLDVYKRQDGWKHNSLKLSGRRN